jgi:hypothetical protein
MRGRSAHRLVAEMGGGSNTSYVCEPFKTSTIHVFHTSQEGDYPNVYNLGNCSPDPDVPTSLEAGTVPVIFPHVSTAVGSSKIGAIYGFWGESTIRQHDPDKVNTLANVYFNTVDLNRWSFRKNSPDFIPPSLGDPNAHPPEIINPVDPPNYVTGPGLANPHAFYTVRRRTSCNAAYSNYLNWCFTDQGASQMLTEGQKTCPKDPFGFSYPAKYIWHNTELTQPFTGYDFYEDTGVEPVRVATPEGRNFIPFCTPINAYSSSGTLLGQFVGYTHIVFFNNNFYVGANNQGAGTAEDSGNLPEDFTSPLVVKPPVKRWKDAHTIDAHIYMVASPSAGQTLKSPRICSKRFWRPNNITGPTWAPSGTGICVPHIYFLGGVTRDNWGIRLKFNVLGGAPIERVLSMGNFAVYLVP